MMARIEIRMNGPRLPGKSPNAAPVLWTSVKRRTSPRNATGCPGRSREDAIALVSWSAAMTAAAHP